ncbi:MAG: NrpR regulatory domain-containing protein, partial [Dehalococcoidia bacterium]
KREIDLLSFLRKHSFPCPHPMQDRMGRFYRNANNRCVSLFKYQEGKVLAGYHEIPMLSVNKADELLQRMKNSDLISYAALARPGERICEVPFNHEKVGLVTLSGLNPVAAAVEAGIQVTTRAMSGMMEFAKLKPVGELL